MVFSPWDKACATLRKQSVLGGNWNEARFKRAFG